MQRLRLVPLLSAPLTFFACAALAGCQDAEPGDTDGTGGLGGAPAWTEGIPPLHTEGRYFKDPEGNVVVLRGVAIADVRDVNGRDGMDVATLIDRLSDSGQDWHTRVIRMTVYPDIWLPDPVGYYTDHLKPAVDHAASRGLYVIIDWHEIANVEEVAARTGDFWEFIAPKFAGYTNVLYELFNEPMNIENPSWSSWKQHAQPWVDTIRESADNVILIGGPFWSQQIGGAATDPFAGDNLAYVGHIYPIINPATWSDSGPMAQVAAVRPLIISEWGFRNDGDPIWDGTRSSFGEPLKEFIERHGMSFTAWCADNLWAPVMFDEDWELLTGEGEMGGFVKEWLSERRDDDQPVRN